MLRHKIDLIKSWWYFPLKIAMPCDQEKTHLYNKCHNVQPLVDYLWSVFKNITSPKTFMSVDEQVISFKVIYRMKCYLPKKWGYNLSPKTGISGYIYNFQVGGGLESKEPKLVSTPPKACGDSDFVVLQLTDSLGPEKHQFFFDNYFSLLELLIDLKEFRKIWTLSALNVKCCRFCRVQSDSIIY